MATINLAPGTARLVVLRRSRRRVLGLAILIVVVVVVLWLGLLLLQRSAAAQLERTLGELRQVETKLASIGPVVSRVSLFEGRLQALEKLLAGHLTWSSLLSEIEKLMPTPTVLRQLKADTRDGKIELTAAAPSLDEAAQTIASLTQTALRPTPLRDLKVGSITRQETAGVDGVPGQAHYNFGMTAVLDLSVLRSPAPL